MFGTFATDEANLHFSRNGAKKDAISIIYYLHAKSLVSLKKMEIIRATGIFTR